ncbi:Contactin-associated protein 1 [Exaiptasia diaphana]|nr:Contactin-associated protein 1 [Exaiptasia diaphana]
MAYVDECSTGTHTCDVNATCTNKLGSHTCRCNHGFQGNGRTCTDVDECSTGAHNCNVNAKCTNKIGSYICRCNHSYQGNGLACTDIDECSSGVYPCHANALCTNTNGSYNCRCQGGSGDGRHTCRTLFPKSCNEQKKAFPASRSGTYTIDPDGNIGEVPYNVYCDMTDKGGVGVTVISHNRENWDSVNNCPPSPGSCSRIVSYNGTSLAQLAKLTEISTRCEQYIVYSCTGDVLFIEASYAWWVSRDGVKQYYWGGATPGSKKCACGKTNTCHNKKGCNCHNSAGGWRTDGGLLTDKTTLPVKEMRFADTDGSNENAEYYLAKLKCY